MKKMHKNLLHLIKKGKNFLKNEAFIMPRGVFIR